MEIVSIFALEKAWIS